jgi:hypothetical protein
MKLKSLPVILSVFSVVALVLLPACSSCGSRSGKRDKDGQHKETSHIEIGSSSSGDGWWMLDNPEHMHPLSGQNPLI